MAIVEEAEAPPAPKVRRPGVSGTVRYVVSKILGAVATLFFVVVFNFFLFRLLPGDPVKLYTRGRNVDAAQIEKLRQQFNTPILSQFWQYLKNPFTPDALSSRFSRPVWDVIGERVWPTILLVGTATLIATVVGVWIGIRSAWNRGKKFDKISTGLTLTLYAMPEFWIGMILLIVFSVGVFGLPGIFPSGGLVTPGVNTSTPAGWVDVAWHLTLPVTALAVVYLAEYSLVMRSSLLDEMGQDYLQTARAKGLMDKMVRRRHAVPNALLPTVTLIFLNLGFVIGGAITIETVFSLPGLGLLSYEALRGPDIPLLQAIFLLFSIGVVLANLVADLLYAILDPRVRG